MYYFLLCFSWLLQLLAQPALGKNVTANIANATYNSFFVTKQPSCQAKCGNLSVPYPFGIGAACSFNSYFEINCSTSKPFLADLEVLSISPTQVRIRNVVISRCYDQAGATTNFVYADSTELPSNGPYIFSDTMNKLTVIGCDDSAQFWGYGQFGTLTTSCGSMCSNDTAKMIDEFDGNCTGIGCCQTDVPKGLKAYEVLLSSFWNHTEVWLYSKCGYAFMGEKDSFRFRSDLSNISDPNFVNQVPIVLDFGIGNQSCIEAQNSSAYLCLPNNSLCIDNTNSRFGGYLCSCENGYEGNPYLSPGCTGINEMHIEEKIKKWKREYRILDAMLRRPGFGWNPNENKLVVENEIWNEFVQDHRHQRHFRDKQFPHFNRWAYCFVSDDN